MKDQTQGSRDVATNGGADARMERGGARLTLEIGLFTLALVVAAESAVWMKRNGAKAPELAVMSSAVIDEMAAMSAPVMPSVAPAPSVEIEPAAAEAPEPVVYPEGTRFYDGRPIRPARTMIMTVTAYSPDWRSCGDSADGITASTKSVYTNGGKMVAADTRVLPMHSMISVPGYGSGEVVPVLDRGGAIKGKRLDVLFPTHEAARKWGVKKLPITVWEYADEPAKGAKRVAAL